MTHSDKLSTTRVIFFQVKNTADKLKYICETAQIHFEKKEHFLFLVDDLKAQEFVFDLLWKQPETSFLPHVSADEETQEFITITKIKKNVNQARIAFNLCATPLLIEGPFRLIYEFEDLTTPGKNKLSSLRFDAYKAAHFMIESRA